MPREPLPKPLRQRGVGLVDALAALLVFSFGLLALAELYMNALIVPVADQQVVAVQNQALGLMSVLQSDPSAVPSLSVSGVSSASGMPSWLQGWFAQSAAQLPGLSVTIATGKDAAGNACSATSCGITLTLGWKQGSQTRSQVFNGQVGFHS
jgi:Tfp pilus assembly protein PilV